MVLLLDIHKREKKKLPYDNYGSFFGPSQPVIAQRVIQESKSLLENERLTAKVPKPNHSNKTSALTSSNSGSKNHIHVSLPKAVNQLKNKVEKLKVARDYSFLLSDDAELPAPTKDPTQNVSGGPTSANENEKDEAIEISLPLTNIRRTTFGDVVDARSAQVPPKDKQSFNSNGRQVSNAGSQVENRSKQVQNGSRQASNGSRQVSNGNRQLSNDREEKKNISSVANVHHRAAPHKLNSASKSIVRPVDSRKQIANNNESGPGRPLASKPLPSKVPSGTIQKKVPFSGAKSNSSVHSMPKPSSGKLQSFSLKQPMVSKHSSALKQTLDQRKGYQDPSKGKILSKQPVPSSKHQISKPSTKVPPRPTFEKELSKKRSARPFSDDEDDLGGGSGITSMIQKLMGYNPNKYKGRDSDDSDMEANFDEILREEERSELIAKKEDEEELRKIEASVVAIDLFLVEKTGKEA